MSWKVYGEKLTTVDISGGMRVSQEVIFNKDVALVAAKTWIILLNDPTFTDLKMKIYNSNDVLLHTSINVMTKAEILPVVGEVNGFREVYFKFDKPVFKSADTYRFRLEATGYTYSDSSHIAWAKNYPDPVYTTGITTGFSTVFTSPYYIYFIGAAL